MSMIGLVLGVTPAQISALRAKPSLVLSLALMAHSELRKAQFDNLIKSMPPERRAQFEANRARLEGNPAAKEIEVRTAEARAATTALGPIEKVLGLEKSWHLLHYVLTGHAGPANAPGDLLLTGEDIGEDLGYGPARLHDEAQTREFSRFLHDQDLERLQARVDLKQTTDLGIYAIPGGPGSEAECEKELRDEVALYFPRLRDYVREMSGKGNGLLVWVS